MERNRFIHPSKVNGNGNTSMGALLSCFISFYKAITLNRN